MLDELEVVVVVADIDTSDIPEADEEWFKRAKLVLPQKAEPT